MRSCFDTPDMRVSYAVPFGKGFSRFITSADISNISVGKACVPMVQSIVVPSLFSRVGIVFGFGSNPQMSGVNARRVVANVHDDHSFGYRPNMVLIRVSMGAYRFFTGKQEDAVSVSVPVPLPFPTTFRFLKSALKHIRRAKQRITVKTVGFARSVVASPAQFPRNSFSIPTFNTSKSNNGLVCHMTPPVSRLYAITEV
jgi:hypothetical protein